MPNKYGTRGLRSRQTYDECGALADLALYAHLAFVRLDNLKHIVQAYAETFDIVAVAGGDAVEVLENVASFVNRVFIFKKIESLQI